MIPRQRTPIRFTDAERQALVKALPDDSLLAALLRSFVCDRKFLVRVDEILSDAIEGVIR